MNIIYLGEWEEKIHEDLCKTFKLLENKISDILNITMCRYKEQKRLKGSAE